MKIQADFSEAQDFAPFPEAVFKVRVTGAEPKVSKQGGNYIAWKLDVFGAEGEYSKYNNRSIWLNTMTSGPGSGILKNFLKATVGEVPTDFDTDTVIGRELQVATKKRYFQGEEQASPEIAKMMPIGQ